MMHPETERELAYALLIELLAHQFTYPVRWIETQDAILGDLRTERVVEIGPNGTLSNMFMRSWEHKYAQSDTAQGLQRRFFGPHRYSTEVYYDTHTDNDTLTVEKESLDSRQLTPPTSAPTHSPQQPSPRSSLTVSHSQEPAFSRSSEKVDDVPIAVLDVVNTIVATKIKKDGIDSTRSIAQLSGGRSTLTNEIIGDLHLEFGSHVPERAEELPFAELVAALRRSLGGDVKLGKKTSAIVNSFISSKFPGAVGLTKSRDYLSRWGLGEMRQDAVLLRAVRHQPESRLSSVHEATRFLDGVVRDYFEQQGLSLLASGAEATGAAGSDDQVLDAKSLQLLNERNQTLLHDICSVISRHLPSEMAVKRDELSAVDEWQADLEELELFRNEHGDDYINGIKPIFDIRKERVYDSFWNWCTRDVAILFDLAKHPTINNIDLIESISRSIINRATDKSIAQIQHLCSQTNGEKTHHGRIMRLCLQASISFKNRDPAFIDSSPDLGPITSIDKQGKMVYTENPRTAPFKVRRPSIPQVPYAVGSYDHGILTFSDRLSSIYAEDLDNARQSGMSFRGKNFLVTGAGRNSIGFEVLKCLVGGGARCTVTTSSYSPEVTRMYQQLYSRHGGKDAVLRVLPFNQGSRKDIQELATIMVDDWEPDFIIPFAAISENGRELEDLDSKSELAHRLMLTNLLRLLGTIARNKRHRGITTRPATVVLPLSPNHGLLGNDGLYAESKRGLETLLSKWKSETWRDYLSMLAVVIGWTRSTGLMEDNNVVAQGVEALGVRTFSKEQMAGLIACLLGGRMNAASQSIPLVVDLSGGMGKVNDLKEKLTRIRHELKAEADVRRAIWDEQQREAALMGPADETCMPRELSRKANIRLQLPQLPDWQEVSSHAATLAGMVDLGRTVVITGFSELGPHGNSRTRWEMEADGAYSLEGCVEMAWMMGLIKHDPHAQKNGNPWTGWVDAKTSEPVEDGEVPSKYMSFILQNTGLREIDPSTCDNNYDPERKTTVQEIELTQDLPPFEASLEVAQSFQLQHGSKAEINKAESGVYLVRLRAGAKILLPKATRFNRSAVAGQIPTGWSAKRYGITDEIIDQVDPVTLFTLVSTVDALLASGIVDPYELYQHIHISEVGNALGSSMGGLSSLRKVHRDRFLEKPVQGDILQETFTSTIGAWCNMLLMSSTGPIKTPVGACATSLESLDTGYDLLVSQKVKVCIVGGVEDFVEDVSFEFGSMQATCDTQKEFDAGRSPSEMSRPTASTRSGFVESQGCGVQILTTAELALELGLPIFGIVAYTGMAADGAGRSVPAPGQGVLGNARESTPGAFRPPLLDIGYRRRLLDMRLQQVNDNCQNNLDLLEHEIRYLKEMGTEGFEEERYRREVTATLEKAAKKQKAQLRFDLGNQFWKNEPEISPIRGSLATWGLGIDDIAVASLHGTSTIKNETNECSVLQSQLKHLGRTQGNLLHCVCQKSLTGHSKAAATAWVVNGACQMLSSGVVPGNRNADNIDDALRQHDLLHFPDTTLKMDAINAVEITSFGFGQKGGQAILVHPKFLYATIRREAFEEYTTKRDSRWRKACKAFSEGLLGENLVNLKTSPPYDKREEMQALLDPTARF